MLERGVGMAALILWLLALCTALAATPVEQARDAELERVRAEVAD
jgi:hypothetical protein